MFIISSKSLSARLFQLLWVPCHQSPWYHLTNALNVSRVLCFINVVLCIINDQYPQFYCLSSPHNREQLSLYLWSLYLCFLL